MLYLEISGECQTLNHTKRELLVCRYALENGESVEEFKGEEDSLKKEFGKWHGLSSLANLVGICGGIAYTWVLANMIAA